MALDPKYGKIGDSMPCHASKYACYKSETEANVFHHSNYTYKSKSQAPRPSSIISQALAIDLTITPMQIRGSGVIQAIMNRQSWYEIKNHGARGG